jgi:hypothetical protein
VPEASLDRSDAAPDGSVLLHLSVPAGEDDEQSRQTAESATAALARACVEDGLPVLELGPRSRSLEDLFVDLLGERPQ